jgi:hypothetical protein
MWPNGLLATRDCFGPCYDADSAYLFDFQQSTGIAFVVALLDSLGRVSAIAAFYQPGTAFEYLYPSWRARFGPPTCGGPEPGQRLPTWLDPTTAIFFGGDAHRDIRIPFSLRLVDRVNPRVARYSNEYQC